MSNSATPAKLEELLAFRKIDQEFLSHLTLTHDYFQEAVDKEPTRCITDSDLPPMPFSMRTLPPDPRIVDSVGGEQPMSVLLAQIVYENRGRKRVFIVSRDTIMMLFAESQDLQKFPKWLMNDPKKINERSIRINEMIAPPEPTGNWLVEVPEGSVWDTLVFYFYSRRSQ